VHLKLGEFDRAASSVVYRTTFSDRTEQFAAAGTFGSGPFDQSTQPFRGHRRDNEMKVTE